MFSSDLFEATLTIIDVCFLEVYIVSYSYITAADAQSYKCLAQGLVIQAMRVRLEKANLCQDITYFKDWTAWSKGRTIE